MNGVIPDRDLPHDVVIVPLDDARAVDPTLTGGKAAPLARAARAGLPVLPGFVIVSQQRTGPGTSTGPGTAGPPLTPGLSLRAAWEELSEGGRRPLVVRSSSVHEDSETSSMAGRFTSVLDVAGWDAFTAAVRTVLASADAAAAEGPERGRGEASVPRDAGADGTDAGDAAMAVLVQPMVHAVAGGVLFGADPVEGRTDRTLISAVRGGPDALVGGSVSGTRYQLSSLGRLLHIEPYERRGDRTLGAGRLYRLVRMERRARRIFGGPQDMEFGFDSADRLWLFQSRPITAMAACPPRGARLLGPGPVAETFPGVLQPMEEDLWVAPMARGLTAALDIAGAVPRRRLATRPVVTTVGGRVAADLGLLGAVPPRHPALALLNPLPGARRLSAAWRVGRLSATLPALGIDLLADVDKQLASMSSPAQAGRSELVAALAWGRSTLVALHAQESLAGALLGSGSGLTAVAEALSVLDEARSNKIPDHEVVLRSPVVLALTPPALGVPPRLPTTVGPAGLPRGVGALPLREGLRLRIRWVQEMQSRVMWELAERMVRTGRLQDRASIRLLRWPELMGALEGKPLPADLPERTPRPDAQPLPAAFRLADGVPVADTTRDRRSSAGQGAGGGRGSGTAWDGTGVRPRDAVLVTRTLDPALAPLLPGLAALVAETGSALSHLAVLARENGVPTAVGVPGALERFRPGTRLAVDGITGEVRAEAGEQPTAVTRATVSAIALRESEVTRP
ncbi:PEP/pyruvate-binding domain-containing protein [Streptomyces sp. KR80]|uniref:PEP/pyruvate-binding domain-containing protein n=1 Tax=Streptomyces sp. KR80 TaxID=3457426 RepID=UPI003FD3CA9C